MKKVLCFILTLCTAAAVVSCGKSKSSDSKSVPETTASTAASTGSDDVFTNDGYTEKIMEKIKDMQVSDEPFEFKEHGELLFRHLPRPIDGLQAVQRQHHELQRFYFAYGQ